MTVVDSGQPAVWCIYQPIVRIASVQRNRAGKVGRGLAAANANDVVIAGRARVADVNVVTAGEVVVSRLITQGDVAAAARVGEKCQRAIRRVLGAGRVLPKRLKAIGHVIGAGRVVFQRLSATGGVEGADRADIQREGPAGRVVSAGSVPI